MFLASVSESVQFSARHCTAAVRTLKIVLTERGATAMRTKHTDNRYYPCYSRHALATAQVGQKSGRVATDALN